MRPRVLDLFCKAGGAVMGYANAGFEVVGVDVEPQPNFPFEFRCLDALDMLDAMLRDGNLAWDHFDAISASPPCQAYSDLRHRTGGAYVDLVAAVRGRLIATGLPYVIENVEGAPLRNPLKLCGSSFGLGAAGRQLRRHRLFECNFPAMAPPCQHAGDVIGVYGTGGGGQMTRGFKARGAAEAGEALGVDWMTLAECAQAVPPAYTEHVGGFLLAEIRARQTVAA